MKFFAAVLALAATAFAAPTELEPRGQVKSCNAVTGGSQVCCNSLLLNCVVQVISHTCTTEAYCCETGASTGGLININALNCVKL
ncbi:hypothetical protein CDD83_8077 [Cordyceps sp. RAO-2017]|nr:hypothetical protein CDD83_8077 [Cordyceps sp. RAO-2017]